MRRRSIPKVAKLSGITMPAALEMQEQQRDVPVTAEQESTIRERGLLVRFSIGRWYGSGADEGVVSELRISKQATGEIGSFTKRLMKRDRLKHINGVTNEARRYHKIMTLPWGDSGQRILSVTAFREYKEKMTDFEARFSAAVEDFLDQYEHFVEDEKRNLGKLWRRSDYPPVEVMRESFRFGLQVDPIPSGKDLRVALSEEQTREIRAEIEARLHASLVGALSDIYDRLAAEVKDAKEKFDDPTSRLQRKMFEPLQEIITLLPKLNVTGDRKLMQLGKELQREIAAIDLESVKSSPTDRKRASKQADVMLGAIAALRGAKP